MLERMEKQRVPDGNWPVCDYDELDYQHQQQQFVDDLLSVDACQADVLDLGTGTAWIPVLVCRQVDRCRIMAADSSSEMLEQARYNIEVQGVIDRVQLDQSDGQKMFYQDAMFDLVISHRLLHEIAEPSHVLQESLRVTKPDGLLFFRDFLRPDDSESLEQMVQTLADPQHESHRQWFRESLQAAWRLDEIRDAVQQLGLERETVQAADQGYWTWCARKPA